MKKSFLIILALFMFAGMSFAGPFRADARTKRVPAGTNFTLKFIEPVNTFTAQEGDYFSAVLVNEQASGTSVILPVGSVVRGCVSKMKSSKRFSRGAVLYLDFDHVVTPNGRQIPLSMSVVGYDYIALDGGLYKNLGYGEAVKKEWKKSADLTRRSVQYGLKAGVAAPGMQYITVPFCAVGGAIGTTGRFVGMSIADIFRKGEEVNIKAGDVVNVVLTQPVDVPVH